MGSRRVICLTPHLKIFKKGQGNKKEDQVGGGPSLVIIQARGGGSGTGVTAMEGAGWLDSRQNLWRD